MTTTANDPPVTRMSRPPDDPPDPDMVWIAGGEFLMGSDGHYPERRLHTGSP
jgi:formylglycine-generating enzyme required for sulfatase activity